MFFLLVNETFESDLEDVSGEVVVEEERAVGEEERRVVEEIAAEQHLADRNELLEDACKTKSKLVFRNFT